ncbi:MAG TPA: sigma-54 dependent transcriptional regulator [Candidatus Krumholzibacteria bacterium]|nr:sigma-54 dependent transcriptional regulator [Candidatus Krumholzibacteria bacterium]HRX52261.1 sigma-54 dependent transcriptional regulator [Candidatus Krumholzibacteria bacterium]
MNRILICDDERNIRRTFGMVLGSEGFQVAEAESGEDALDHLKREGADLLILDVRLPGIDGLETLRRLRGDWPELPVIMISGHGTIATAVEATRFGAFDFLEKPCSRDRVLLAVQNALKVSRLGRRVADLEQRERERHLMVGESEALKLVRAQIDRAAPTGARILIRGESGTGKELVARAVHEASDRKGGPFVKVNCAAIPEELIESELFGSVKGAFTGATADRDGKFLQAHGGTLFLDEIGDMSLRAQAKVLRALQEGEIEKVGGSGVRKVDVRVVAATNRDLEAAVKAGEFREDLFFRLNVVPMVVPPLRERRGDIPLLADFFLARYCDQNNLPRRSLTDAARRQLAAYAWPGNVRELHNAIERLAILCPTAEIGLDDLALAGVTGGGGLPVPAVSGAVAGDASTRPAAVQAAGGLVAARQKFEADCIVRALDEADGNVSQAARLLGIDRTNLHKKIQAYGLER